MTIRLPTALTAAERRACELAAAKVTGADQASGEAREAQNALWLALIEKGRAKVAIAKASGVTPGAVHLRLSTPPSRVNRGIGNRAR